MQCCSLSHAIRPVFGILSAVAIMWVDGAVIGGLAVLDRSALTGESVPVQQKVGDGVMSGATNVGEAFQLLTMRRVAESNYAGIVRLVEAAQRSRADVAPGRSIRHGVPGGDHRTRGSILALERGFHPCRDRAGGGDAFRRLARSSSLCRWRSSPACRRLEASRWR